MLNLMIGTMKASKSSILIDMFKKYQEEKPIIFYPACCDKKDGYVVSRDKDKQAKAIKVFEVQDMYNYVDSTDLILIDEVQFIVGEKDLDEFMQFLEYCDRKNKRIFCFGLSLDYLSKSFIVTERILPYADTVTILSAYCDICGSTATRCIRYIDGVLDDNPDSDVLVMEGRNVEYKSICKKCYRELTGLNAIK